MLESAVLGRPQDPGQIKKLFSRTTPKEELREALLSIKVQKGSSEEEAASSVETDVKKALVNEEYLNEIITKLNMDQELPEKSMFDKIYDRLNEIKVDVANEHQAMRMKYDMMTLKQKSIETDNFALKAQMDKFGKNIDMTAESLNST